MMKIRLGDSLLTIELVAIHDIDLLKEISFQTFYDGFFHLNRPASFYGYTDKAFSKEQLMHELNNPLMRFFFLKKKDLILAYFKLNYPAAQSEINQANSIEIERIYVKKEYQNFGYGKILIDTIKKICSNETGLSYIWLGVWEKNKSAIRFYERNGFKIFSSHPFQLGEETQTDLLMKWEIPHELF